MPRQWGSMNKLGGDTDLITVEVNNILTERKITNVFGVIKGFVDAGKVFNKYFECTFVLIIYYRYSAITFV